MHSHLRAFCFALFTAAGAAFVARGAQAAESPWREWQWLIGEWEGLGNGQPGQATGGFSLTPGLNGTVLVRKSHADYPAANGRAASSHEDMTIIYAEAGRTRADYYDSEGHVIRYTVDLNAAADRLTFLSDPMPKAPQFRLTYIRKADNSVALKFEIAPPSRPFATYLEASVRRK